MSTTSDVSAAPTSRYDVYVSREHSPIDASTPKPGYRIERWRPSLTRPRTAWLPPRYLAWSVAAGTHVFRNHDYWVYAVLSGEDLVHYSCVVPKWFRWPLMHNQDIQVSNTWTSPDHRGRGLARVCLSQILADLGSGRAVWYVTRPENFASVRVCESVGFRKVGRAQRVSRLNSRLLGALRMEDSPA